MGRKQVRVKQTNSKQKGPKGFKPKTNSSWTSCVVFLFFSCIYWTDKTWGGRERGVHATNWTWDILVRWCVQSGELGHLDAPSDLIFQWLSEVYNSQTSSMMLLFIFWGCLPSISNQLDWGQVTDSASQELSVLEGLFCCIVLLYLI